MVNCWLYKLSNALEEEEEKAVSNTDYQKHLQTDILRLAGERKDLTSKIKELKTENDGNKTLRDKELADLRKESLHYKTQYTNVERNYHILNTQLTTANTELAKEKGRWDKWINDNNRKFVWKRYNEGLSIFDILLDRIIDSSKNGIVMSIKGVPKDFELMNLRSDQESKKIIKRIYEYYRDK